MTTIGNYEVLCALKSGGMGDVLLGRRRGPGMFEQLVAIKTIRSELAGAETVRAHFLDEAAILAKVNHGAVAGVHDFGESDGTLYMVMEYVAGISFRDLMDLKPPPTVVARAIAEACRGLHAAHDLKDLHGNPMGVVHRDISPDNLIMSFDGHIKVIDFGIALIKNRQAPATEFGSLKGKPAYMSPEQIKNGAMDRRSDIFSLAVVLWEMLTQQSLFEGDSIYAIVYSVENQLIAPPSTLAGALPFGLDAAVLNGLERDLDRRTPTAAAFAEQLEAVVTSAGEETLEAWAERCLAEHRDKHRQWLAGVIDAVDGKSQAPVGRPQGQVTAIGGNQGGKVDAAAAIANTEISLSGVTAPSPNGAVRGSNAPITNVGDLDSQPASLDELVTSRKKPTAVIAAGVLLLGGLGVAAFFMTRSAPTTTAADAALPPTVRDAAQGVDAAPPLPVVIDAPPAPIVDAAPPPIDARHGMTVRPDARPTRVPVDAPPPKLPKPDAPEQLTVKPSGEGTLVVIADPFANVSVDGKSIGATPLMIKLPAGAHRVVITAPEDGNVLKTETINLVDKQTHRIKAR